MRVLFTALSAAGHCYPLVPTAWAMRNAGHDVRFASAAGGIGFITGAGLTAVSTGDDLGWTRYWTGMNAAPAPGVAIDRADHERERALRSARMFAGLNEQMVEPLLAYCRGWRPDVVVFDPRCLSGAIIGRVLGLPTVRHCWGPDSAYMRTMRRTEPMEELCDRFGVDWFERADGSTPLVGTRTLEPAPASLRHDSLPGAWGVRYVPFNGSGVLAESPRHDRSSVTVVWSRTFTTAGGHVEPVQTLLDALAGEPVDVTVLMSGEGQQLLERVPDNAAFLDGVAVEQVLPSSDLLVHAGHGGPTMSAVAAGCPQLIFSGIADGSVNSTLICEVGAGLGADYRELTPEGVRDQARQLLGDPVHRDRATALRRANDALPGPDAVADRVAQLV